jgi:aminoglycoside phosphotransferase
VQAEVSLPPVLARALAHTASSEAVEIDRLTHVLVTPRFHASAHVVFLLVDRGSRLPVLVAKTPRVAAMTGSLVREATALRAFHDGHPELRDAAPRLVSFDAQGSPALLLETAVVGDALAPDRVRRAPDAACRVVMDWLCRVRQAHFSRSAHAGERLLVAIAADLDAFGRAHGWSAEERQGLGRASSALDRLSGTGLPVAFEHGDLSHPNLILQDTGALSVVDWELAAPQGLPMADAFAAFAYIATARDQARDSVGAVRAYDRAVLAKDGWARGHLLEEARGAGLDDQAVADLEVLCWTRSLARSLARVSTPETQAAVSAETVAWLRDTRIYGIWRRVVTG